MRWVLPVAVRCVGRRPAILLSAWIVLAAVMAGTSGLTALVTAAIEGGQPVGSLAVFLAVTAGGLASVALGVFAVVRTTLAGALAALRTLGAPPATDRVLLASVAVITALAALPLGAVASWPVEVGVRVLLRVSGYHAIPSGRADHLEAVAVGAAATVCLGAIGAVACGEAAARSRRGRRRFVPVRWGRPTAGVLAVLMAWWCAGRIAPDGGGALLGCVFAAWCAATLLAAPLLLGLYALLGRAPIRRDVWPVMTAARADRAARLTSAVTVATATLALYAGVTGAAAGVEGISRAAVARALADDAVVVTAPDGSLLPEATAQDLCRRAGQACIGLVHVAPVQMWPPPPAVVDARTAATLIAPTGAAPRWRLSGPGFVTGPWSDLAIGTTHSWTGGSALVVSRPQAGLAGAHSVREWAATAPSATIIRGSGAGDVLPMLSPLIILAALYAAGAAYTAQAGRAPMAALLTRLGAGRVASMSSVGVSASAVTAVAFAVTAGVVAVVDRGVHSAAAAWGLDVTTATTIPPRTFAAAVPTALVITFLGLAGARAGRLVGE